MMPILAFRPYYKEVLWGGRRIADFKGIPSPGENIGESWEISDIPGCESTVLSGRHKGETLSALLAAHSREIIGKRLCSLYGRRFPLLVKFIDSSQDLSLQVHPDDGLAASRHNSFGKTEMWYSLSPLPGAYLYAGFNRKMNPERFLEMVSDSTIMSAMTRYGTSPGDTFLVPAGNVHAIGSGNLVIEIQQASDISYRIFDYNRKDKEGNLRQLHIRESVDAIDYQGGIEVRHGAIPAPGEEMRVARCRYFNTDVLGIDGMRNFEVSDRDSFTILIVVDGKGNVTDSDGNVTEISKGETLLVPAEMPSFSLEGEMRVVSVFVP